MGFPGGSTVENPPAMQMREMQVWSLGQEDPLRRKWQPLQFLFVLPEKSHGQRSLVGYSATGCEESDTTKHIVINV